MPELAFVVADGSPDRRCWAYGLRRQLIKLVDIAGEDHFTRLAQPDEGWQQSRVDDRRHADLDLRQTERRSRVIQRARPRRCASI